MEKHTKNNEAYTNKTKSKEMKVELAAVFLDIIRRKALPKKVSLYI